MGPELGYNGETQSALSPPHMSVLGYARVRGTALGLWERAWCALCEQMPSPPQPLCPLSSSPAVSLCLLSSSLVSLCPLSSSLVSLCPLSPVLLPDCLWPLSSSLVSLCPLSSVLLPGCLCPPFSDAPACLCSTHTEEETPEERIKEEREGGIRWESFTFPFLSL